MAARGRATGRRAGGKALAGLRRIALQTTGAFGLLGLAVALAATVAAAPPSEGDWVVNATEVYADQEITLAWAADNSSFGNLSVGTAGVLHLDNVTLFLPTWATFDVQGRVEVRNSTLVGGGYRIWVRGSALFEGNTIMNATFGGTIVETMDATFERNRWDCGGISFGTIHIRRPIDFRNNTMLRACHVAYELTPLETDEEIEFAWNTFNDSGSGTLLTFTNARHNGSVRVDIHNITVIGGGWSIVIGATAPNTSYHIHDSTFRNNSLATVRVDDFEGDLRLWNLRFDSIYRAARINGVPGRPVVAHIDNITVNGTQDSIYAEDATWVIRNSTIGGSNPQYQAGSNGHVMIYDTADTAFSATASSSGSVEHFAFLNIVSLTWQGGVPFVDDAVSFRNATGRNFLNVTPWNWTPSYIAWWGVYNGNVRVDNRDLRPSVVDGLRTFACTPSQFFVTVPMTPTVITCTDDAAPVFTVAAPTVPFFTQGLVTIHGRLTEAGAGIAGASVFLGTWVDLVATVGPDLSDWNLTFFLRADATYSCALYATDRAGNRVNITYGPFVRDTEIPRIEVVDDRVPINRTTFELRGFSEPDAELHVRFSAGWNRTAPLGANGSFSFTVPVADGQNTYLIIATDRAGNSAEEHHTVVVDRVAPALSALLNGRPDRVALTTDGTALVRTVCDGYPVVLGATAQIPTAPQVDEFEVPLSEGPNRITVRCVDLANNEAQLVLDVFFDRTAPTLSASLEGNEPLPDGKYVLRSEVAPLIAVATDGGSGVGALSVNGVAYDMLSDGTIAASLALKEGENLLRILAVDAAGNSANTTLVVVRDTAAPTLTVTWQAAGKPVLLGSGGAVTAGYSVLLVIVLSEAATVVAAGVPRALTAGTTSLEISLTEGQNRVAIELEDAAGNTGVGVEMAIVRDSSPPSLSVDDPQTGAEWDTPTVTVRGEAEPGSRVFVQGKPVSLSATGQFHTAVALTPGSNTVTVEAADALGNTANTSLTVTYAPAEATPPTTTGGSLEIPMLVVGMAVGAGAGAVAMLARRRQPGTPPSEGDLWGGPRSDGPAQGAGPPVELPPPARMKGPRGPRPPP